MRFLLLAFALSAFRCLSFAQQADEPQDFTIGAVTLRVPNKPTITNVDMGSSQKYYKAVTLYTAAPSDNSFYVKVLFTEGKPGHKFDDVRKAANKSIEQNAELIGKRKPAIHTEEVKIDGVDAYRLGGRVIEPVTIYFDCVALRLGQDNYVIEVVCNAIRAGDADQVLRGLKIKQ